MKRITAEDPESRSPDSVADNITQLARLFPEAFTEGKVNFAILRELLDDAMDETGAGSVKYEEVYLHAYESVAAARVGLGRYFRFYNAERRHQGLGRRTPDAVYADSDSWPKAA